MGVNQQSIKSAIDHLRTADPVLAELIATHKTCDIRSHTDYYPALVTEIIGQQLSTKAARAIRTRFLAAFGGTFPASEQILGKTPEELRSTGISWAKARYIRDLAQHVMDGKITFDHLDDLTNEEIIKELTDVKGIGEWTVHMFLMFCMGRLDVLATGDLGIRNGIKKLYSLARTPSPTEVREIAEQNCWHPYETVACWYIWQALDNAPSATD